MRCNDCEEIFEEADKIYERQGDDFSYYPAEEFLVCPYCGSDNIEETQACLWCEEEQEDAICPDCVKKLSTDETILRYSADEPEEIELGSIYLLHFSGSEIEEILLREIKESGRLYTENGEYMICKFIGSKKSDWKMGLPFMFNEFTVLADNPVWITEKSRSFIAGDIAPEQDLDYAHDYPYDYTSASRGNINWDTNHYASSEFLMRIYGPCVDPRINIEGHIYQVHDTLDSGDYVVIDSLEHTVIKYRANGTTANLFDMRGAQQSIFEPIPGDVININWSGDFGFDLTLFEERSEPRW